MYKVIWLLPSWSDSGLVALLRDAGGNAGFLQHTGWTKIGVDGREWQDTYLLWVIQGEVCFARNVSSGKYWLNGKGNNLLLFESSDWIQLHLLNSVWYSCLKRNPIEHWLVAPPHPVPKIQTISNLALARLLFKNGSSYQLHERVVSCLIVAVWGLKRPILSWLGLKKAIPLELHVPLTSRLRCRREAHIA